MLELLERDAVGAQELRTFFEPTPIGDQAERYVWGGLGYSRAMAEIPPPARPYEGSNLEAYHAAQAAVQLSIIQLRLATEPALRHEIDMEIVETGWLPSPDAQQPFIPAPRGPGNDNLGVIVDVRVPASSYRQDPPIERPAPPVVPVIPGKPPQTTSIETTPGEAETIAASPAPAFKWRPLGSLSLLRWIRWPRRKETVSTTP